MKIKHPFAKSHQVPGESHQVPGESHQVRGSGDASPPGQRAPTDTPPPQLAGLPTRPLQDFPHGLPHGKGPDEGLGEYPENPPPYELPHNPLRFLKKFPKKLIPKVLKLFHLDTVLQEIMLSLIAIDDDTLRNEVATELSRVADGLQEPLDKFSDMLGQSIRGVLSAAIPVLGGFYVVNDMANAYKTTAEVQEQALGPLNDFVTRVKDLYDSSVESNRLLSSMIYAGIDTVTDEKWRRALEAKRNEAVGRAAVGPVEDRPPTKEMARLAAAGLTRNLRENMGKEQISGLLNQLRANAPGVVEKITEDLEPAEQQDRLGTGKSLLDFLTDSLESSTSASSTTSPLPPPTSPLPPPTSPSLPPTPSSSTIRSADSPRHPGEISSQHDLEAVSRTLELIKQFAKMTPDVSRELESKSTDDNE